MGGMTQQEAIRARASARDSAMKLMNRATAGVAFAAVAGLGIFGYAAEVSHPGAATLTSSTSATGASAASSTTTSGSTVSSGSATSTSSSGVAVSGGS